MCGYQRCVKVNKNCLCFPSLSPCIHAFHVTAYALHHCFTSILITTYTPYYSRILHHCLLIQFTHFMSLLRLSLYIYIYILHARLAVNLSGITKYIFRPPGPSYHPSFTHHCTLHKRLFQARYLFLRYLPSFSCVRKGVLFGVLP